MHVPRLPRVFALLASVLGLPSCASCFDSDGTPSCDTWATAAPALAIDPAWGVSGTSFVATFSPLAEADDYEAAVAVEPFSDWTPLPADVGSITFTPDTPGRYQVRVRALRDGCDATEWGTADPVEVRMTWTDAGAAGHWTPRVNHESVVFAGQVWVLGGFTDTEQSDEIWTTTDGTTWAQVIPITPHWTGRGAHEAVVFDDRMWVLGGSSTGGAANDVWWSDDGLSWTEATSAAAWSPRLSHEVAVFDDALWLAGGTRWIGPTNDDWQQYNDVWTSGDGITWVMITSAAPWAERAQHTLFAHAARLWIAGGGEFGAGGAYYDDLWSSADGSV